MSGLELSAVVAFSIAGVLLLFFGVAYYLADREARRAWRALSLTPEALYLLSDRPVRVSSRPRLYDWDAEGDFR